jgi:UDP-N-acetylglucosamine--N-acetylmuramyl-(pentapeptide) pyrophosphoryl-undecaprenol N-acetylglucosamine transferase
LAALGRQLAGWRIVHQAGGSEASATRQRYDTLGLEATVVDFLADMPGVLAASSLAVCRAGGVTLAELAFAGVPALLLPYPHAADDHQRRNAEVFAQGGAAVILDERGLAGGLDGPLAAAIAPLVADPPRRRQMSLAMRRLARPQAAAEVAQIIRSVAQGRSAGLAMPVAA